jgi:hypothetical protein
MIALPTINRESEMSINVDYLNGYLDAMSSLNTGTNHGCDYSIQALDAEGSWMNALEKHYAAIADGKGQRYHHSLWHINAEQIRADAFSQVIADWFLHQPYSPHPHPENSTGCVDDFIDCLAPIRSINSYLYRVTITPPMAVWYDIVWQDLLLIYQDQRYLLHFGFSD